ncbi:MAG: PAS domain S-box protein [Deltaproteobacteria bacterium]|nr:PAS domain S-box protein [Candidatus Zymogenaceae bacterium]
MSRERKNELSISPDMFEQYLHIAEVMILLLDRDARISYINRKGAQILGFETSQLIGSRWIDNFIPERNREEVENIFHEIVTGKLEMFGFYENPILTKSGEERIIRWHNTVLKDGDGELIGALSSGEDVTERRIIEEALQRSRDDWENIFQAVGDPTFILDTDHKIIDANRAAVEAFGTRIEEITGQYCFRFCHGLESPAEGCPMKEILKSGDFQRKVMKIETLNGTFLVSCTPILKDGEIERIIHVASDITEQKRIEDELIDNQERFRSLVEDINDVIFSLDLSGTITYISPVFERIFSYDVDTMVGSNFMEYIHPDDLQNVLVSLEGVLEGDIKPYQYRVIDKDGTPVFIESSSRLVYLDGSPVGLTGVLRDITEKKKMQEQFQQTEKLSSLGEIISGVAHELNNPLTTIVGFSELVMKKDVPEGVKEDLKIIYEEAIRSSKIIKSLLTFARKHTPEKKMIKINDVIREAYKLREYELRVDNVNTEFELSEDLPETCADPYQLQQVFINLINNAHHALLEKNCGRLKITTCREGNAICIVCEDNGPGILNEHISKIFDPFFTTKEVGRGTGLGLSVVYGIVSEHDGEISVESEEGNGTKFTIRIPIITKEADSLKTDTAEYKSPEGAVSILVVEDESLLRKFISTVLISEGYNVEDCESGEEAIEMIKKGDFDLIISDMKMSGIGGQNLYTYVQKYYPDLVEKMLFITGDVLGRETQNFFKISGCKYLEKPFTSSKLLVYTNELLD